jgi:transposase
MVTIYMKNDILSRHRQNMSNREIAKDLGISKDTVNKYVNQAKKLMKQIDETKDEQLIIKLQNELVSKPIRKSVSVKKVFSGNLERRFYELLFEDENKNTLLGNLNKQKLTASLLHRKLRSEGFDVGITTIQQEFKKHKNRNLEAYIKQEYDPGFRAEYDFHEIKVLINGKLRRIYQATITLPSSGYIYIKHYENQKMETFLDSIISFLEHIGGIPKTMVFDNMRNVVRKFVYRGGKEYTEDLIKLSNYYGFKIITTNPRRGNEKGHVEKGGKTARQELFTFNYKFNSINDLRKYALKQIDNLNTKYSENYVLEQKQLMPLPKLKYELGRIQTSIVDNEALVSIDGNHYSVPDNYVRKSVYSQIYIDYLSVYNEKHELIASHKKIEGKGEHSIDILHYTSTFSKKPGALINSVALKQAPKVYQTLFHKYFTTKVKEFIKLIKNNDIYELNELLVKLETGTSIYALINNKSATDSIESVSLNQLNQISQLFNQGEMSQ